MGLRLGSRFVTVMLCGTFAAAFSPGVGEAQSTRPAEVDGQAEIRSRDILNLRRARAPGRVELAHSPEYGAASPSIDALDMLRDRFSRVQDRRVSPLAASTQKSGKPLQKVSARTTRSTDVGDTLTFNTPNIVSGLWDRTHLTVVAESDGLRLWVATSEWNDGDVAQSDVDAVLERLTTSTPPQSRHPTAGILEINTGIFGDAPDYDGDGILDVLWYDIRDAYISEGSGYAPVVVTLDDTDPDAEAGIGNQADIIYLDTHPTLTAEHTGGLAEVEASLAGGHVSLIQLGNDRNEVAFIRVSLIEIGKVVNGYGQSPAEYLTQTIEHNIPMLSFGGFLGDRQRGELLMRYAIEQLGIESVGFLTRDTSSAASGLVNMIDSTDAAVTIDGFIADFHTANFLNDRTVNTRFGYADARLSDVGAVPTFKVDASLFGSTPSGSALIESGGVVYAQWENVSDLEITADAMNPADRALFTLRAIVEPAGGSTFVTDVTPSGTPTIFSGATERVTLVIVHSDLSAPAARIEVGADWEETAYPTVNIVQDDATLADVPYNFILLGSGWIQAVRFDTPNGAALKKVFIRPFFRNQFIDPDTGQPGGPPGAPRDVTLMILADDGFGQPGDTLDIRTFTDPTAYSPFIGFDLTSTFVEVDYGSARMLGIGENIIYVAMTETGTDTNWLALALAGYTESTSLVYGPIGTQEPRWYDLWSLTAEEEDLDGLTIPIRAQFQVPKPVSVEQDPETVEPVLEVDAIHPNPARGEARVTLQTRDHAAAEVAVFDLLGRRVWRATESTATIGLREIEVSLDAVASGVYIIAVTLPDGTRRTQRIVLL